MKRIFGNSFSVFFGLALMLFVCHAVVFAQAQKTELEKKYAAIIGDYEFDLSDMGMGVIIVNIFCDADAIYAQPEISTEPGEMQPVEDREFEFVIEDPDEGTYMIKFLKDEQGKYTKCHVVNETMGMDTTGTKLEK